MEKTFKLLDFNAYRLLYNEIGSKNLTLQSDMAKDVTTKQLDLYLKTLDFIYRIISVIGIFAGFGLTALSYVVSLSFFIAGEMILVGLILTGLYFIPKIYINEYDALERLLKKYCTEVFNPRNEVLGRLVNSFNENGGVYTQDVDEILSYDKKLLNIMSVADTVRNNPLQRPITVGLGICVFGVILLLLSFLPISTQLSAFIGALAAGVRGYWVRTF